MSHIPSSVLKATPSDDLLDLVTRVLLTIWWLWTCWDAVTDQNHWDKHVYNRQHSCPSTCDHWDPSLPRLGLKRIFSLVYLKLSQHRLDPLPLHVLWPNISDVTTERMSARVNVHTLHWIHSACTMKVTMSFFPDCAQFHGAIDRQCRLIAAIYSPYTEFSGLVNSPPVADARQWKIWKGEP